MFITSVSIFSEILLIVLSLLLWVKESPVKRANRMLGRIFLLLAVLNLWMLFLYHAYDRQIDSLLSWYLPLDQVLVMFIGPLLYFYLLLLYDHLRPITTNQIFIHALPALPALVYVVYFITLPLSERIAMVLEVSNPKQWMDSLLDYLFYLQLMPYLLICFLKVCKQRKSNYLLRTNRYQADIRWLYYALGLALAGLISHLPLFMVKNSNETEIVLGTIVIALLVGTVFLQSLFSTGLSMQNPVEISMEPARAVQLEEHQINDYLQRLDVAMNISKIYLNTNCTLKAVANQTDIPQHHLSHVINTQFHKNFSDFINEHRCKHACKLLEDSSSQKMTLEAIGTHSGFGSRVNFNNVFKKFTGKSPSAYQADQNQN
jgi:AraC-like DNA-binding protein